MDEMQGHEAPPRVDPSHRLSSLGRAALAAVCAGLLATGVAPAQARAGAARPTATDLATDPVVDRSVEVAVDAGGPVPVIVTFTDDAPPTAHAAAVLAAALPDDGSEVTDRLAGIDAAAVTVTDAGLDALVDSGIVARVEPDVVFAPLDSPSAGPIAAGAAREAGVELDDAAAAVGAPAAAAAGATGAGWTVAVLDTGVDLAHPYFAGKVGAGLDGAGVGGGCFTSGGGYCPNGSDVQLGAAAAVACPPAGCDHGTHVAGIAVGNDHGAGRDGVAPDAGLFPVQVFSPVDELGSCSYGCVGAYTSDVVAALELVVAQASHYRFAAVNLSLGSSLRWPTHCDDGSAYERAIEDVRDAGIAVVIAAGNDGDAAKVSRPACYTAATAVSATSIGDDALAGFSNAAPAVTDLAAPGVAITSSVPGGGFGAKSGTSMATPVIAGALAALRTVAPGPTSVDQLVATMQATAQLAGDPRSGAGYPRLDLAQAAAVYASAPTPAPSNPAPPPSPAPAPDGPAGEGGFVAAVPPRRVLDTRVDPHGRLTNHGQVTVPVGADPAGGRVVAAALNVTAVGAGGPGYLTVWPCDETRPEASTVNMTGPGAQPNAASVGVAVDGAVCVYSSVATDVVVDVFGWYREDAPDGYVGLVPARVGDTRSATGLGGRALGGAIAALPIAGHGGVAADAAAVAVNVTAADPDGDGYVTLWPCGQARPDVSTLNLAAGRTRPNLAVVGVGEGGAICIYASTDTDVIVDVQGYFASGGGRLVPVVPARLADTRVGPGPLEAGATLPVAVRGTAGVAADATAVSANVTAVNPSGAGYLTVWPCGRPRPEASNLNVAPGDVLPNAVISAVGDDGTVCVYTSVTTDVVVDVTGYFTSR